MKNLFSLSSKWLLQNKNVITIILTAFITLIGFYNSALNREMDDGKQKVFEKIVKLSAINSSYAGNLSYVNLLLSNIQDCREAKSPENDLLKQMCSALQNSYEREIFRETEFTNSIEEAHKELDSAQSEHLIFETKNRFIIFLTEIFFYIFSAIIIIINVANLKNKIDIKK